MKFSIWSLLLAILSCFYATCSIMASLMIFGLNNFSTDGYTNFMVHYYIGTFVFCIITAVISLVLRNASVKRGLINKMTKASKLMNVLSIIVSSVFTCVCFIIY